MGEKAVTLSAYTAERLIEYRELYARYEEIVTGNHSDKSDNDLIMSALYDAIENIREFVIANEKKNAETEVQHET